MSDKTLSQRLRMMYIEAQSKNPGGIEGFDTPLFFEAIAQAEAKEGQAIGEQTPVTLNSDQIEQVSSWWQRRGGHDRLARAHFEAGMREVLAHRSPMSSDARDLAIAELEITGRALSNYESGVPIKVDDLRRWNDQALSALRG